MTIASEEQRPLIQLAGVNKFFGRQQVLREIRLKILTREVVVIVALTGPVAPGPGGDVHRGAGGDLQGRLAVAGDLRGAAGGGPMSPAARASTPVVLGGEEVAYVRQVLVACAHMLTWAQRHGGPAASALAAEMTRQSAARRSPSDMLHDIDLALDYLDVAPAARSPR